MIKKCSLCLIEKDLTNFYLDRRGKLGRYARCKPCFNLSKKPWLESNKDKIRVKNRNYARRHVKSEEQNQLTMRKASTRNSARRKIDPNYAARRRFTSLIASLMRRTRSSYIEPYLGCSINDFRAYIASKFTVGMNWTNYGRTGWHVDHIIPLSSFDLTDENDIKRALHYTNTQPLWAVENKSKGSRNKPYLRKEISVVT